VAIRLATALDDHILQVMTKLGENGGKVPDELKH
jgi:hypothetical protein